MKRVFHSVVSAFMLMVLNVLSLGVHATASPVNMEHSMDGSHPMNSSNCFTACTTAILSKDDHVENIDKEKDDEPSLPFYVVFQTSPLVSLKAKHSQDARVAADREPPPGASPAYIGLGVFRA